MLLLMSKLFADLNPIYYMAKRRGASEIVFKAMYTNINGLYNITPEELSLNRYIKVIYPEFERIFSHHLFIMLYLYL